jgi:hypothetical protein
MPESEPKPKLIELVAPGAGQGWKAVLKNGKAVVIHEIPVPAAEAAAAIPRIQRLFDHPHPALSPVLAWGTDPNGMWVANEPNEGVPLGTILARGPLTPPAAAALGAALLSGVAALHEAGIAMGGFGASAVRVTGNGEVRLSGHPAAAVRGAPSQSDLRADVRSCGMAVCAAFGVDPAGAPAPANVPPGLVVTMRSMASGAMGPAADRAQGALREMASALLAPDRMTAAQSELATRAGGREMPSITPFLPKQPPAATPPPAPFVPSVPRDETPLPAPASYDAPPRKPESYTAPPAAPIPSPAPPVPTAPPSWQATPPIAPAPPAAASPAPPTWQATPPPAPAPPQSTAPPAPAVPAPPSWQTNPPAPAPPAPAAPAPPSWQATPPPAPAVPGSTSPPSPFQTNPPGTAPPGASPFGTSPPASPFGTSTPAAQQSSPPASARDETAPATYEPPASPHFEPVPPDSAKSVQTWTAIPKPDRTDWPADAGPTDKELKEMRAREWAGDAAAAAEAPAAAPAPSTPIYTPPAETKPAPEPARVTSAPARKPATVARRPVERVPSQRPTWMVPAIIGVVVLLLIGTVGGIFLANRGSHQTTATGTPTPGVSPHPTPKASPTSSSNVPMAVPTYAPASASPVTSVQFCSTSLPCNIPGSSPETATSCDLNAACHVEVGLYFSSAQRSPVAYIVKFFDRCTGVTTDLPGPNPFTPPGYNVVILDKNLTLPSAKSAAIVAVSTTPAAAASTPLLLGASTC